MSRAPVPGGGLKTLGANGSDGYLEKLAKYVPVEGLAPFVAVAALAGKDWQLWVSFGCALLLGIGLIAVQVKKQTEKPGMWFWPFVVIAFVAWSIGASDDFRKMLDVSVDTSNWILAISAVALPGFDSILDELTN
ncbi:MAG: hypothetical protein QOF60_1913 [Actinomycetota bacterium]|jgi:hypothetical protein|nr:hypothetical protein [Actinomycetota bacterium]